MQWSADFRPDFRPERQICLATPRGLEFSAAARAYAAHLKRAVAARSVAFPGSSDSPAAG